MEYITHFLVATVLVVTVSVTANCTMTTVKARTEATKVLQAAGADLLDVPCALETGTEHYCTLRAASRDKK